MTVRLSRRQVLVGAAGLAGTAAAGTALWRLGLDDNASAPPPTLPPLPSPTVAPTAAAATPSPRTGGTVRAATAGALSFDTFDAARSGEPSVLEVLGRTHSRLLNFGAAPEHLLEADLAVRWEQPDAATWVFTLNPGARWHDRTPVGGRAVTADDVVAHLRRALALGRTGSLPLAQRAAGIARIDGVSAVGPGIVRAQTSAPDPLLLQALAGRFALVQAPEAVEAFADRWHELDPETVVGSGPFRYGGRLRFSANLNGHSVPSVDTVEAVEVPVLDDYASGAADEYLARDRRDAPVFRGRFRGAQEFMRFEDSPVISSFALGAPPWNNPALRLAVSGALQRRVLIEGLFGLRAVAAGPVPPAVPGALPGTELAAFAGYGQDARDARAHWEAAGGPGLGEVIVDFPSIFDPRYGAAGFVIPLLNEVLGPQFRPAIESYPQIARKVAERRYGDGRAAFWFGWGPPLFEPDDARLLLQQLTPERGAEKDPLFADAELARVTAVLSSSFAPADRRAASLSAQRRLLALGGGGTISWVLQTGEFFRRETVAGPPPSPFAHQHLDRLYRRA